MNKPLIHPDDDMFTGSYEHYDKCGRQMAGFAKKAAELAAVDNPRVLELPCGYGRVTRHLVECFDPTRIHAADIMVPAVDYTVETFGVNGHYVVEPVNEFNGVPESGFDVAIMGSLLTHLSENDARVALEKFLSRLSQDGVAVITTHGDSAFQMLRAGNWFELEAKDKDALVAAYTAESYGFANYTEEHEFEKKTVDYIGKSYGVSLASHAWMMRTLEVLGYQALEYASGAWDNHQDVFWIRRT